MDQMKAQGFGESELSAWTDREMVAGEVVDEAIVAAIRESSAVLLLVSASFLNSEYVRRIELPEIYAAQRRRDIPVTWLAVRPIAADTRVRVGDEESFELTRTLGLLNSLNGLPEQGVEREKALIRAIHELRRSLVKLARPVDHDSGMDGESMPIRIDLRRHGAELQRDYFVRGRRVWQNDAKCPPLDSATGQAMFEALFPDEQCREVLGIKNPHARDIQIRIRTDDVELMTADWWSTTWQGHVLPWVYELEYANRERSDIQLPQDPNCRLIMPDPNDDLGARAHEAALRHALSEIKVAPVVCATRDELKRARDRLGQAGPDIVVCYGAARVRGELLELRCDDAWIPLGDLISEQDGADLVVLHLVGVERRAATAALPTHLLATSGYVVLFVSNGSVEPCEQISKWFADSVTSSDRRPLIGATEALGSAATVWSHVETWERAGERQHVAETRPTELLLDRELQRSKVAEVMDKLLADDRRRVAALVAYGCPGNNVGAFGEQAEQFLLEKRGERVGIQAWRVRVGPVRPLREADLRAALSSALPRAELGAAIEAAAVRRTGETRAVVLLDWGAFRFENAADNPALANDCLEAWVRFQSDVIAKLETHQVRVISLLACEADKPEHGRIKAVVRRLGQELERGPFLVRVLTELAVVEEEDLRDTLVQLGCSDNICNDLARLIHRDTDGHFDRTVDWLDRARESRWSIVLGQLREMYDEADPPRDHEAQA